MAAKHNYKSPYRRAYWFLIFLVTIGVVVGIAVFG